MLSRNQRITSRIVAYAAANVGFFVLQRHLGWLLTIAIALMVSSARVLARADADRDIEEVNGLPK